MIDEPLTTGYGTLNHCSKCDYEQFEWCFGNARGCEVFHKIVEKLAKYERADEDSLNSLEFGWEVGGKNMSESYCSSCGFVPKKNKIWVDKESAFKFCPECGKKMTYCDSR